MSFDALTLAAVRDELEPRLVDARVQRLAFPDDLSLALECFSPHAGRTELLITLHPDDARVHAVQRLPARGVDRDSPFALVARKYLRHARVRSVRQPRLERVLELECEQRDASGQHVRVLVIVEAMGRRSNLVLVDADGTILDALRRSPPSRNPRRPVLPRLRYTPPPPQARLMPEDVSAETLASRAPDAAGRLARFLSDTLAGLSPLAGRELAFRAAGNAEASLAEVDWPRVAETARAFLAMPETHAWQPTLAMQDDAALAYAPYVLEHLRAQGAELHPFTAVSEAIEAFHARAAAGQPAPVRGDPLAAERRALAAPLERALPAAERRVRALEHQLASAEAQREPLRQAGELILAHLAQLEPGATALDVDGQHIELDPHLSASDNAQAYFARYRRVREAEARVPALLDDARQHHAYLAELRALVEVADQMDAIRALRREVAQATSTTPPRSPRERTPAKATPYRRLDLGAGWEALVGTSAAGNAAVTFGVAAPEDLWLHARGVPGAHVILRRRSGVDPPPEVLERAAALAAWHSAARSAPAVEVDVTPRRYVRKIPNAPLGLVRYHHERTLRVAPGR